MRNSIRCFVIAFLVFTYRGPTISALNTEVMAQPAEKQSKPLVEMYLHTKQAKYVLDLDGKTPAEFRKLLAKIKPDDDDIPSGPVVDLVLEIINVTDKDVTIWVGGDDTPMTLELKGPGAVNKVVTMRATADIKRSKPVVIPPGKCYALYMSRLDYPRYRPTQRWYWTEPGEYMLTATFQLGLPIRFAKKGDSIVLGKLVAEPIKLIVVNP